MQSMDRNSKRVKISEVEEEDRISTLPDSVLSHILSFLPTKDAVKTTVLAPRFRNPWTTLQTLDFDHCAFHECGYHDYVDDGPEYDEKFMNYIRHVLILHDSSSISKFRLRLRFCLFHSRSYSEDHESVSREKSMANEIDTWVRFAVRKRVEVLDIDLLGCSSSEPEYNYLLPNVVFNNSYLTELNLACCDIKPQGQIILKSLKMLSLNEVGLSDKTVDNILSGCQLLEELSLRDCYGLSKLCLTHPSVKKLLLVVERDSQIFTLSCPHVVSLDIAGWIERVRILDVSSVADASLLFSYRFRCERMGYGDVQMLLQKLSHSKNFSPCTWSILVFTIWQFLNLPCPSFSWRSLALKISPTKWHQPGISLLLRKCPYLETLTMYIYPGWHSIFTGTASQWIQAYDFDAENYWNSQDFDFHCLKHHLKKVMIFSFITEPYVIQMLKFLLKSAMVLEEIVISSKKPAHQDFIIAGINIAKQTNFTAEELLEFSQKLLSFPRASTKASCSKEGAFSLLKRGPLFWPSDRVFIKVSVAISQFLNTT